MKIHFTLILLFITGVLFAQNEKVTVGGMVTNTAGEPLAGATIVLLTEGDSILYKFAISGEDGLYTIKKAKVGKYIHQITFIGHQNYSVPVEITGEKAIFNMPIIKMESLANNLQEIEVKAEHVPIVMKKDTIEYNAAAFETKPNKAVEDLLKKLPGVEVDDDGKVTAQGEEVTKILVDGKEFFGDDPTIATKNLPADAVEKVQVYDKLSDIAEFSGIDDGERQKTINLALKKDKKSGLFGNIAAGYGTEERFESKFNINKFDKKLQLSTIGMANNNNQQGFSISDYVNFMGGISRLMRGGSRFNPSSVGIGNNNNGITTTGAIGANLNYDFSKKSKINVSYFYNYIDKEVISNTLTENYNGARSSTTFDDGDENSKYHNHKINTTLEQDIDSTSDLKLRMNFSYNQADYLSLSSSSTSRLDGTPANDGYNDYNSDGLGSELGVQATFRKRLRKPGRLFTINLAGNWDNNDNAGDLTSVNNFYIPTISKSTIEQVQDQKTNGINYSGTLNYTEPLGNSRYLGLTYTKRNVNNDFDKDFNDILNNQQIFNDTLSTAYESDFNIDRAGISYQWVGDASNISIGSEVQFTSLDGVVENSENFKNTFTHFLPNLNFRHEFKRGESFSVRYRTSVQTPNVTQLSPVVDNSNPLAISMGNPDLEAAYRHSLRLRYFIFDQFSFTSFFATVNTTYTQNKITNAITIDPLFRQISMPVNVDNDLNVSSNFAVSTPLKFIKSRINFSYGNIYSNGDIFIGDQSDIRTNWMHNLNLRLENRNKKIVDAAIGARVGLTTTEYNSNEDFDQSYQTQTYFGDLTFNIGEKFSIGTAMDYRIYSGDAFDSRQEVPIWTAEANYYFLKYNKGTLRLSAFDLLNKNQSVTQSANLNTVSEQTIQAINQYYMLTFLYSISKFGQEPAGAMPKMKRRRF